MASEAAKVRVVRCNIKAENDGNDSDASSSVRSDGGKSEGMTMKLVDVSEKRTMDMSDSSNHELSLSIGPSSRAEGIPRYRDEHNINPIMNITRDFEDSTVYGGNSNGLVRSKHLVNGGNALKSEVEGPWRPTRMDSEDTRYQMDGPSRHDYVYQNRGVALERLDELREKVPLETRTMNRDIYARENYHLDPNFRRQPYQKHYAESFPRMNVPEMEGYGFYPPRYEYGPSLVQGFGDPLRPHMVRRRSHQAYMPGLPYSGDAAIPPYMDEMRPYPSNFRQSLDSRHVLLPPTAYWDKYENVPSGKMFDYYRGNPGSFGPRDYDHRVVSDHHLRFNNRTGPPGGVNSEGDGFVNRRAQRVQVASSTLHVQQHRRRPVAGGAPFMTCCGCFKLLVLPKRVEAKGCSKMKCGACSTVISLVFSKEDNPIILLKENNSIPSVSAEVKDNHNMVPTRGGKNLDSVSTVVSSDGSDYELQSKNIEVADISVGHERVVKVTETKNRNSASYCASEDEKDSDKPTSDKNEHKLAEDSQPPENPTPQKKVFQSVEDLRPPAGSPLLEHFEFSNKYYRGNLNHMAEGNRSSQHEKGELLLAKKKPAVMHKKASSATEIDLSSNEFYNSGTIFDSDEASGEGDKLKQGGGRSAESLLAGVLRRSLKDSNRMSETPKKEKVKVTVNGHAILDESVQKAQKIAGKIQPGNYWYDFRAGFWGVEGGPCLGVIPPYIEELNFPMPVNCAGGNTNIFVNGRELHHKDLNLLVSRGLPSELHRSYLLEISGRVFDEASGEELEGLGKLAPTVERAKHGFGMKVPKAAA